MLGCEQRQVLKDLYKWMDGLRRTGKHKPRSIQTLFVPNRFPPILAEQHFTGVEK